MKKIIYKFGFLVILVFLGACNQETKTTTPQNNVVTKESIDWSKAGPDAKTYHITFEQIVEDVKKGAVFYDVRSASEFSGKNFGITTNYPVTDMESGKLPDVPKDTKIYVHCQLGIRSADATRILRAAGYTQVYDMGGIAHVQAVGGQLK